MVGEGGEGGSGVVEAGRCDVEDRFEGDCYK